MMLVIDDSIHRRVPLEWFVILGSSLMIEWWNKRWSRWYLKMTSLIALWGILGSKWKALGILSLLIDIGWLGWWWIKVVRDYFKTFGHRKIFVLEALVFLNDGNKISAALPEEILGKIFGHYGIIILFGFSFFDQLFETVESYERCSGPW